MRYSLPITGALGADINKQYVSGDWDWVILNGGGNDLWLGCGCMKCDRKLEKLIAKNGQSGTVPNLVSKIRSEGAQVIYVGYLRTPGVTSPVEHCTDEGEEFERRLERLSKSDRGIHFLSLAGMVPEGSRDYHWVDLVHPSVLASEEIGERITNIILNNQLADYRP
ncbi:hypothetical protein GCM10011517_33270 [Actibacterium pelagium]|uniref:SGNH hydrolase-type esterase domain-containing protein n=2 Tax=Actibacterium pelagium TaxID=2029103 RepID=A0A917ANB4_9RHOB|nr:hypothetical protein GCM10011517_33270 [Actibacterium pelagium]